VEHSSVTPNWVKHTIFYQIFPDRFAFSNNLEKPSNLEKWDLLPTVYGIKGGDLLGVVEKLDYLSDLGINGIYLNPIFQSVSSHRYHTHDYFQVDPILGGIKVFRELLNQAHQRGIRVILDGVFNHSSRGFFQFNHVLETGEASPYLDWFTITGFPLNAYGPGKPNYKCWWDLPGLPEFNTQNPQVRRFIFDIARYWIDQGIDGWRLDVPFCIDDDSFWQEFRQVVKSSNPEAYIVGEVPWEAHRWLQGDQFDAVMNYQFTQACLGFFAGHRINRYYEAGMMGLASTQILDAEIFSQRVQDLLNLYPHDIAYAQLNLLDSHDMPRFISLASGDWDALKLAVLFQMTYPGAPCIYYGDEIGMQNGPSTIPEHCRKAFPWDRSEWNTDPLQYYKKCIHLRNANEILRTGDFEVTLAKDELLAFKRNLNDQSMLVVINTGIQKVNLNLAITRTGSRQTIGMLNDTPAVIGGGSITFSLPARSGEVFSI
jgi:cyclomaltodextrinase / maltogenic alpha-amylase / neopullulanase